MLLVEVAKKKPKVIERPKKTLHFNDKNLWHHDLKTMSFKGAFRLVYLQDERDNIFAVDQNRHHVYGIWNPDESNGVTFHEPKVFSIYKHDRKHFVDLTTYYDPE